jgi:hypothetical protein
MEGRSKVWWGENSAADGAAAARASIGIGVRARGVALDDLGYCCRDGIGN